MWQIPESELQHSKTAFAPAHSKRYPHGSSRHGRVVLHSAAPYATISGGSGGIGSD